MTKIIIDIFMYLFEFMLFWNYSNTLFKPKKNKKIRLFLMLLNTLVLCTIYQFNITYLNVVIINKVQKTQDTPPKTNSSVIIL